MQHSALVSRVSLAYRLDCLHLCWRTPFSITIALATALSLRLTTVKNRLFAAETSLAEG
jgi:hypothetical protein